MNVRFRLEGDEEDFEIRKIHIRGNATPINYMAPGESEIFDFGVGHTLFADPPMKPVSVVINYDDVDGESYERQIELNVRQFHGLAWPGTSVSWRQMTAVEGIERHLRSD